MRPQQTAYVYLAAVFALVLASFAVPNRTLSIVLAVLAVAAAAMAMAVWARQRRDPNGPRGQH